MQFFDARPQVTFFRTFKSLFGQPEYYEGNLKDSNKANKNDKTRWGFI